MLLGSGLSTSIMANIYLIGVIVSTEENVPVISFIIFFAFCLFLFVVMNVAMLLVVNDIFRDQLRCAADCMKLGKLFDSIDSICRYLIDKVSSQMFDIEKRNDVDEEVKQVIMARR
jgi:hypothetical protein